MTETKTCLWCKRAFSKPKRRNLAWWAVAKYCCHGCARAAQAVTLKPCEACGTPIKALSQGRRQKRRFCSPRCAGIAGRKPSELVKGRYRSTKSALNHRRVMEAHLGRKLLPTEFVHHKNGNKLDNRPENLEIVDPVTHGRMHHLRYPVTKNCAVCATAFTPHKTKRKRNQTCGRIDCKTAMIWRTRRANATLRHPIPAPGTR